MSVSTWAIPQRSSICRKAARLRRLGSTPRALVVGLRSREIAETVQRGRDGAKIVARLG